MITLITPNRGQYVIKYNAGKWYINKGTQTNSYESSYEAYNLINYYTNQVQVITYTICIPYHNMMIYIQTDKDKRQPIHPIPSYTIGDMLIAVEEENKDFVIDCSVSLKEGEILYEPNKKMLVVEADYVIDVSHDIEVLTQLLSDYHYAPTEAEKIAKHLRKIPAFANVIKALDAFTLEDYKTDTTYEGLDYSILVDVLYKALIKKDFKEDCEHNYVVYKFVWYEDIFDDKLMAAVVCQNNKLYVYVY